MNKSKNIFGCIWITIVIWGVARFVPAFVSDLDPNSAFLKMFAFIVMLPIGWLITKAISKGKHCKCIRANLYIFAFIEARGIFTAITYLMQNLAFSTGRYTTDVNGIAYANYPMIFGNLILLEIVYIALCIYFARKTETSIKETPACSEQIQPEIIEKNHDEKQQLRDQIAKLKNELKEFDKTYTENKKILAEAFSDEVLNQMVENGEFPADHVDEYISQRKGLTIFVNSAPKIRDMHVEMISDLEKQLALLEPPQAKKRSEVSSAYKLLAILMVIIIILLVAILVAIGIKAIPDGNVLPETTVATELATEALVEPVARPKNGQIIKYPRDRRTAQMVIDTHLEHDQGDYYFALVPAANTESIMNFYVRSRSSLEIMIPPGEYEIYFASGETWNGTELLFGPDTVYRKANGTFTFTENEIDENIFFTDDKCFSINYNVDYEIISESDFPK